MPFLPRRLPDKSASVSREAASERSFRPACHPGSDPASLATARTSTFGWRLAGYTLCLTGGVLGLPGPFGHLPGAALLLPLGTMTLILRAGSLRAACLDAFLAAAAAWVVPVFWVRMPALIQGGSTAQIAWLWPVVIAVGKGMYLAIFAFLIRLAAPRAGPGLLGLYAGLGWFAMEMAKSGWCKCPLLQFVTGLSPWPWMIQGCSLAGAYGLAALLTACAAWAVVPAKSPRPRILCAVALLTLGAHSLTALSGLPEASGTLRVAVIQGNSPVVFKWDPAVTHALLDRYAALSEQAVAQASPPDVVIWPETTLPTYYLPSLPSTARIRDLTRALKTHLILGVLHPEPENGEAVVYNRAVLLGPDGPGAPDLAYTEKTRLVPFGEYIPRYFTFIPRMVSNVGQVRPGRRSAPLVFGQASAGVLICFESMYPGVAQGLAAQGANILVNISNDAWFKGSPEPDAHLNHAVLRAVEQGLTMVRATNTGITSVIDARGRMVLRAPQDEALWVDTGPLDLNRERTFYHLYGDTERTVLLGAFFALAIFFAVARLFTRPKA